MMHTIETTHIEPAAELSSCPFCGAEPFWLGHVIRGPSGRVEPHFYHPGVSTDKDCVLSGKGFSLDEVGAWNLRSSTPQEPDDALIERMGEALFALSDSLRESLGKDDKLHARYEEVVAAWNALTTRLQAKAPEADLMAENQLLRAENGRLSQAVCSGILGELLTSDENEALVAFIKTLRAPETGEG